MIKTLRVLGCSILFINIVNAQGVENIKALNRSFEEVIYTNFNEAKSIALQAVSESEKVLNDTLLLESYDHLSKIYLQFKSLDSSLFYCNKALTYATKLHFPEKESMLYNRKGKLARANSDFKGSLSFHKKALSIAKSHDLAQLEVDINNSYALLYRNRLEIGKAFKSLEKAIDIALLNKYQKGLSESYNIKGLLFYDTHKDSTIFYYNKGLKIARQNNDKYLEGILLSNIGDLYLNIENYNKAIVYLEQAEHISKTIGNKTTLYYVNMSQAIYNESTGQFSEAIKCYEKVLSDYKTLLNDFQRRRVYWLLSGALWNNDELGEAFYYQEKYIFLNDSIFNTEKEKEFQTLQTQYEVEKKDNQIVLLEKEGELARTRRNWIIVSAILLAIPLLGLFLFYRHRAKTQKTIRLQEHKLHEKEKERLEQEQKLKATQALIEGQDKERDRIAKELHDGIGGELASINLSLSHLNLDLNNESITEVNHSLKKTFRELRALSHDLSSNYHKDKSFNHLLGELKQKYEQSKLFTMEISVFPQECLQELNAHAKHNLYRIIQELLANIAKHAKAQLVQLSFNKHDNVLVMILEDDGKGFDVDKQKNGIGIKNIKQRLESINATFTIDSTIGKGTSVIIENPIDKNKLHED
ncbi:hypothetical protein A8C32_17185 [Flavivirga aquatica]|uniref:histidine kinase n=1 Tax=Flavivirga aquatica TaxID=1849968 RepID=A0A1E5T831_9FLAO|nr:histidine kinase [Flavivirga aquatica]OEK07530.1 hypothetical protein A8C32_17185 [Flavivirga aquatica]